MKLSIIVLSFNTKELTLNCLHSLTDQPINGLTSELIVVDNASTDGSTKAILAAFPQVTFIQNQRNLGFAAGNNLGLKVAKGDYCLLLNSDTIVPANTLELLVDFMDKHPKVGAVTPKVILPDGRLDLACHRGMPTPWNAITYFSKLEKLAPRVAFLSGYHQLYQDFSKPHQIEATAATAMMVRRKTIDEIGLLDERFFLYGEDLDWCKRMTDAGWEIWYYPQAKVMHYKSASGKNKSSDKKLKQQSAAHFYDTMKQFYEKHYTKRYPKWLRQIVYWGIDLKKKFHR